MGFLNHRSREYGERIKEVTREWTKAGRLDIWLHKDKTFPRETWIHKFPRYVELRDKETNQPSVHFWEERYVCWEHDETNVQAYKRANGRTGPRVVPPETCPFCIALERVREAVETGQLDWYAPIFAFNGSSPGRNGRNSDRVIRAAGFFGGYPKKPTDEDHRLAAENGVSLRDGWRETAGLRCHYVAPVVDHNDAKEGLQIFFDRDSVFEEIRKCIEKEMLSNGPSGDPRDNPYCMRVTFDSGGPSGFGEYGAMRINSNPINGHIAELIEGAVPNLDRYFRPFNGQQLRGFMEKYAMVDLGWDEIFAASGPNAAATAATANKVSTARVETRTAPIAAVHTAPTPVPDLPRIPCDKCGHPMLETELECAKCGTVYEMDEVAPPVSATKKAPTGDAKLPF